MLHGLALIAGIATLIWSVRRKNEEPLPIFYAVAVWFMVEGLGAAA